MAWYNGGTVTVTNGSTVVTGAGTDFVNNVSARDAFALIGGNPNEIASVDSKTQLTLARPWLGASASGQAYVVQPTVGIYVDLALRALNMLVPFQAVIDGVGQGLIPTGTAAVPGLRFADDQDTGIRRHSTNALAIVAGGVDRLFVGDSINTSAGGDNFRPLIMTTLGAWKLTTQNGLTNGEISTTKARLSLMFADSSENCAVDFMRGGDGVQGLLGFRTSNNERARIDEVGNFLVGTKSGTSHIIQRDGAPNGGPICQFAQAGGVVVAAAYAIDFNGVDGANSANAAFKVGKSANNRSLATSGTINASGADYAEYMTKADGCGTIAAGDVCGVDVDGKLTRYWAAAISFVVKSTDPSLVGGDIWAAHMDPKPDAPGLEPTAPGDGPVMPDSDEAEALATWHAEAVAHTALVIAYPSEHAAWVSDQAKYKAALDAWEAELETARQCVDRIAFCGQVPVNVTGEFAIGDYVVAVANGSGIKAVAVAEADITFDQYRRRIGKIWAVRDGRAWIDVQHG